MKNQQKSPRKALILALVLGAAGAAFGYFGGIFLKSFLPLHWMAAQGAGEKIWFLGLAFFAIWAVIAIHELGHLSAGLAQGFRLALYTAGFLGVRGTGRGPQFFFNRQVGLMGGLAATVPERLESGPDLRRKFVRIVAAGPLSSLLLSVAAFLILSFMLSNPDSAPSLAIRSSVLFLLVTGVVSGLIFLATMIPSRAGGFMSDGARLRSLLAGGEAGRYEEATLLATVLQGAGQLPGEYPADLLETLLRRAPDSLLGLNGHFTAFSHHLDRGETAEALRLAQVVEAHISAVPPAFQGYYLKDVVFCYAFLAGDAARAHATWAGIQKQAERNADAATYRVKAALAWLDGDPVAAADFAQKGLAKIDDLPFEGQRRFEAKWLQAVLGKVRQQPDITIV